MPNEHKKGIQVEVNDKKLIQISFIIQLKSIFNQINNNNIIHRTSSEVITIRHVADLEATKTTSLTVAAAEPTAEEAPAMSTTKAEVDPII